MAILSLLGRDTLKRIVLDLKLKNIDLRSKQKMCAAIQSLPSIPPKTFLRYVSELEAKAMCEYYGIADKGNYTDIIELLLREETQNINRILPDNVFPKRTISSQQNSYPSLQISVSPVLFKNVENLSQHSCFVAIDFETADYGRDSACSIALVKVLGDQIIDRAQFLIRPPRRTFIFTYLHGISWKHVANEPQFHELWPQINKKLEGAEFIAAHNASFDQSVLMACCQNADVSPPALPFQCTVRLARKIWKLRRANLPTVCTFLGIPLKHHNATSDAEACAMIVIAARQSG
ncbi:MAG: 3'-5' exonuclease [Candidatus Jettenia sp.]|nr:3'-5' exonuclease [Candidatus Jettenia sp.]